MNTLTWLTHGFEWVLQASWKASVLVILVLVVQWLLGSRLPPRWRYGLWTIVLVRLFASGLPESPVSVFSLTPTLAPRATPRIDATDQINTETAPPMAAMSFGGDRPSEAADLPEQATSDGFVTQEMLAHPRTAPTGAGSGRSPMATGLSSSGISSRKWLVWINLLVGVLCHLHWFNPLIWLAARQVRVDMEMACDASVLQRLPSGHSRQYGETLLKEGYARSHIESTDPGGISLSDWGTFGIGKVMTINGRVASRLCFMDQ